MKMAEKKWSNVKQLLRERENQLELSLGTTVVFLQTVAELLAWLKEKLQLEAISATPPANVESLRGFVEIVEVMCGGVGGGGERKTDFRHMEGGGREGEEREKDKCGEGSRVTHMHPDFNPTGKCRLTKISCKKLLLLHVLPGSYMYSCF